MTVQLSSNSCHSVDFDFSKNFQLNNNEECTFGKLKLKELRQRSEETLGEKFDVREFHDLILSNGAVPLDVLEQSVEEWLESVKDH